MISLAGLLRAFVTVVPLFYAAIVALMYMKQDALTFGADPSATAPQQVGVVNAEVVSFKTPDGETLNAWYTPAAATMPVILFLHGNGGNISHRPERYRYYTGQGLGVLFVDYRGYGGSTGKPSEQGLVTDAEASYDWLLAKGVPPQRIVVVGESLGTGIAVKLAARRPVVAVALEAAYSSLTDVAADRYWWLPVQLLMKNPVDAAADVAKVNVPLLFHHGDSDETVPIQFGRKLFDAATGPKTFVVVPGGTHFIFTEKTFAREVEFFRDAVGVVSP
jgi:fermentation-respiration switch protein FrsA (DUF1100 family)